MQFIRLINKTKILIILIIIIISTFTGKNSITLPNNQNKSKNLINKSLDKKINSSFELSFSQIKEKKNINSKNNQNQIKVNQKPFDKISAIKLLIEIGKHIIQNYSVKETSVVYNKCIESIKENLTYFEIYLKKFWIEMHLIAKNESITEIKKKEFFFEIFKRLYEKNIKLNPKTEVKCRSALMLKPIIKRKDLISILNKEEFFGGFTTLGQIPFIDSMFSVYRQNLPKNAFKMINKSSIGLPSFKINSEGLRQIASISAEEIREIQNERNKNFAYDNHIDIIGNYNPDQTSSTNQNENDNNFNEIDRDDMNQNEIINNNKNSKTSNVLNNKNLNHNSNNNNINNNNSLNNKNEKNKIFHNLNKINVFNNSKKNVNKVISKNNQNSEPNINNDENNKKISNSDVDLNIDLKNKSNFDNVEFSSNNVNEIKPIMEKINNENTQNNKNPDLNKTNKNNDNQQTNNVNNKTSINKQSNIKNLDSNIVTKNQKIHILNNNEIEFPGGTQPNLDNVEVSLNPNLAPKNIVINRKIIYPKAYESVIKEKLNKIDPKVLNSLNKITKA